MVNKLANALWYRRLIKLVKLFARLEQARRCSLIDASLQLPFGFPSYPDWRGRRPLAIVIHIFHPELTEEIVGYLRNISVPANLYISTDTESKRLEIIRHTAAWTQGTVTIRMLENRGRDIAPKLVGFADIYSQHDIVLFLHSKKTSAAVEGNVWRQYLYSHLLGSQEIVDSILTIFLRHPAIGAVVPQHHRKINYWLTWIGIFPLCRVVAQQMNFQIKPKRAIDFPSGSMFWARTDALRPLLDLHLEYADFAEEEGQLGGTIAHAIERLFLFTIEKAGFSWVKVSIGNAGAKRGPKLSIASEQQLERALPRCTMKLLRRHGNPGTKLSGRAF